MASHSGTSKTISVKIFGVLSSQDLEYYFSQFGHIAQVHPFYVPDSTHNLATHITFTTPIAAAAALVEQDIKINEYRVQVYAHTGHVPHQTRPVQVDSLPRANTVKVSIVGGIITSNQLCQLLASKSSVLCQPKLVSPPQIRTGSPNYAYMNFRDPESAKLASQLLHYQPLGQVKLLTRLDIHKSKTSQQQPFQQPSSFSTRKPTIPSQDCNSWQLQTGNCTTHLPVSTITPPLQGIQHVTSLTPAQQLRTRQSQQLSSFAHGSMVTTQFSNTSQQLQTSFNPTPHHSSPFVTTVAQPPAPSATSICIQYPDTWQPQTQYVEVFEVKRGAEWNRVASKFQHTMQAHTRIVSIQRIQNKTLWENYAIQRSRMLNDRKPLNEKKLFHGSRETSPKCIYESKHGIDFRFCDGLWGQGGYFAVNASLAHLYKHVNPSGCNEIFMATVLTGESTEREQDESLRMPPPKPNSTDRYDTVTGIHSHNNSRIYIVYEFALAYPEYLITYS